MRAARNAVAAAAAALVLVAALVTCQSGGARASSIVGKDSLVIGVKGDQPGLGLRKSDGSFVGFDVDVATFIAGRLGVDRENVRFRATTSDERERLLRDGAVDMVLATYSITPERHDQVTFAGPYYIAHQDILVRGGEKSIKNVRDLAGRRLCQAAGSNSWRRVTEERRIPAKPVPASSYSECITHLANGRVDAISTDDLILAGYAAGTDSGITLVNAPFTNEKYGVGIRKGDRAGCEAVNRILTEMYQNGAAETLLNEWFGTVGLDVTTTVPQFEGCP